MPAPYAPEFRESPHCLVTGAAGFIGSHLCQRLLDDGWVVTGVDSFAPTYDTGRRRELAARMQQYRSFSLIEGDLLRIGLDELIQDVDAIFHLAARPGVRSSWDDFEWSLQANVMATKKLLYSIVSAGTTPRLVFASSSSVYGLAETFPTEEDELLQPISPYGVTKASAEQLIAAYIEQYGIDVVTLRYFTVYGPRQRSDMAFSRWINAALTDRPLTVYGDGSAIRDFTYVDDVVAATVAALDIPSSVYNVAGGSPASVNDAISLIADLCGKDIKTSYQPNARGDPGRTGGDVSRITQAAEWVPQIDLRTGLARQIEWARGSGERM